MTFAEMLRTATLVAPLLEQVHEWLEGDDSVPEPAAVRELPDLARNELAVERMRRRQAKGSGG